MTASHFLVRKSAIEKRWDPFFFQPHLVALEARVQAKAEHTLRDFTLHMAGGSTPLKSEGDQHYTNADFGIPFIRVQNLTTTGELDLQDVKHITHSTHSKLLGRSRLTGGELLVKITGVGRMAVASVVPLGVEANINQHISAIRTTNIQTSDALAAYLNLDFVEQLATRRATGGTRPALDYAALLSIPVIQDVRIATLMQAAFMEKKRLELEAAALLAHVDDVLYKNLGIEIPIPDVDSLNSRIFKRKLTQIDQRRWDCFHHQPAFDAYEDSLKNGTFPTIELGKMLCAIGYGASVSNDYESEGIPLLRIKDLQPNKIIVTDVVFLPETMRSKLGRAFLKVGDFLITRSGTLGVVAQATSNLEGYAFGSFMIRFRLNETAAICPTYLSRFMNSSLVQKLVQKNRIGAIQGNITIPTIKAFRIPLPPKKIQERIVVKIETIERQAASLQKLAQQKLVEAKAQVEKMILGD